MVRLDRPGVGYTLSSSSSPIVSMGTLHISESVREQLQLAMVDEEVLLAAVDSAERRPIEGSGGKVRCRPVLPVPRPLDPETAELRRLDVVLESEGDDMRIVSVDGLDTDELS